MLSFCCGLGFVPKLPSTFLNEHLLYANMCSRAWDPSVPSFENIFLKSLTCFCFIFAPLSHLYNGDDARTFLTQFWEG